MKKLLAIIVLGLLWNGNANAGLFGSSDIIKFYECYDPSEHKNFKSLKNTRDYKDTFEEWTLTVDLKKNNVTRTIIWADSYLSKMRKKTNVRKIEVDSFPILSSTSNYVVINDGTSEYTLNTKNGDIQLYYAALKMEDQRNCSLD
jgi:hypothetical protein